MRNSITLNGISSNSINGLLIQSLPPITKPLMRTEIEQIDGRAGDIVTNLGFSSYNKEFTIGLYGNYDVDQVIAFFNSQGIVTFSNEPDKYYNYQIIDQIDFEKLIRFKTAKVTMHCQPFKYSTTETPIIVAGVNLISFDNYTQTLNGITITAQDGNISLSGTSSANTEIYMPINSVALDPGDYELQALASGTNPEACSLRLIYNSPSSANSFGGTYMTFVNNMDVNIESTLSEAKTYNYLYFYISSGQTLDFRVAVDLTTESVSGSGNFITLEETSEAPFVRLDLKGDTDQTTYSGKNLMDFAVNSGNKQGLDVSYDPATGIISVTGTSTAGWSDIGATLAHAITAGQYTISTELISGSHPNGTVVLQTRAANNATIQNIYVPTGTSKTVDLQDAPKYRLILNHNTGVTLDFKFRVQMEHGSTATSFEQYVGGTVSPNALYPQNVRVVTGNNTVTICGKNNLKLAQRTSASNGITSSISDGIIRASGTITSTWFNASAYTDHTVPAGTYRFSIREALPFPFWIRLGFEDGTFSDYGIPSGNLGTTITITRKAVRSYTFANSIVPSTAVNVVIAPQLELGTSDSTFEPYKEQSYPLSLGDSKICAVDGYKDTFYKSENKWYKHKVINYLSITNPSSIATDFNKTNTARVSFGMILANAKPTGSVDGFNNYCIKSSVNNWSTDDEGYYWDSSNGGFWMRFLKSMVGSTQEEVEAWLQDKTIELYYVLAESVDEEITNETLKAQLEAIYRANSYRERTHIYATATSGNLPFIMDVKAQSSNDGVVTNAGNIVAKPKLTIYGSGDIAVYLNGNQLFNILLGDENYITIDTDLMEAYKDTPETLKNRLVDGDYNNFALLPGENTITFSGSVDKCIVENYSRWL